MEAEKRDVFEALAHESQRVHAKKKAREKKMRSRQRAHKRLIEKCSGKLAGEALLIKEESIFLSEGSLAFLNWTFDQLALHLQFALNCGK